MANDNIHPLNGGSKKDKGDVLTLYDKGYLQWVRLTANDKQLLDMRNELRTGRENQKVNAENAAQHERLQREAELLLRMCGYLILSNEQFKPKTKEDVEKLYIDSQQARNNVEDLDSVVAVCRMGPEELNSVVGLRNHIATDDAGNEWIVTLTPAD